MTQKRFAIAERFLNKKVVKTGMMQYNGNILNEKGDDYEKNIGVHFVYGHTADSAVRLR